MNIKVITAANHKYKDLVLQSIVQCRKLGYAIDVYDLGNLGFGKLFVEPNERFQKEGVYCEFNKELGWFSKAIFKPAVILDAIESNPCTTILWLDADANIVKRFPTLGQDFDVGLAVREQLELDYAGGMGGYSQKLLGRHNAGVIFFNPTDMAKSFVTDWVKLTAEKGNDQYALHLLLQKKDIKLKEY